MLHELSDYIFGKLYYVSRTSFIKVYTKITTSISFFLPYDFSAHTGLLLN